MTLELSTNLPEGHYGLLAELPSSPDAATALFFEVSAPSPPGSGGEEPEEEDEEEQGGTSPPPTGSPLSPSSGPTSGGTVVTIPIEYQDGYYWFGETRAHYDSDGSGSTLVKTRPSVAGTVAVAYATRG